MDDGSLQLAKTNVLAIPGALIIGNNLPGTNTDRVHLARADQIAAAADVTVNATGLITFDIANAPSETIGSLSGSGSVSLAFATLTAGGNNADTTFSGTIGGVGLTSLIKEGTGSMVLSGNNTCSGKMVVNNGHLYVNGSQTCQVQVSSKGRLHGQGTVGALTSSGGWAAPGDNLLVPSHGTMNSASLALDSASHFNIDLGGTAASGKYNQLVVAGSVGLGQATLQFTQSAPGKTNDQFVIVKNNGGSPVNGIFLGLQEGAFISVSPSQQFKLTYQGGASGHDVVLTQLIAPPAPNLGGITKQGNGQIQIDGSGIPGWNYTVQANTNLSTTNWIAIGSALANGQGQFQFIDPDAPNHPMRFYRFLLP
jgi:autotransporter-associated beta strand protein